MNASLHHIITVTVIAVGSFALLTEIAGVNIFMYLLGAATVIALLNDRKVNLEMSTGDVKFSLQADKQDDDQL